MCDVKVKDKTEARNRRYNLGTNSKTCCNGMGMCCQKNTLTE